MTAIQFLKRNKQITFGSFEFNIFRQNKTKWRIEFKFSTKMSLKEGCQNILSQTIFNCGVNSIFILALLKLRLTFQSLLHHNIT